MTPSGVWGTIFGVGYSNWEGSGEFKASAMLTLHLLMTKSKEDAVSKSNRYNIWYKVFQCSGEFSLFCSHHKDTC